MDFFLETLKGLTHNEGGKEGTHKQEGKQLQQA